MAYTTKEDKAAASRRYYHANLEKRRAQNNAGYQRIVNESPELLLLRSAKSRAKGKEVPFSITKADVHIPTHCPVLGLPLVRGIGMMQDCSPTIDRIVPELGYIPSNIRVISYRANRLKCDATLEEIELILADFRTLKKEYHHGT